MWGGLGSGENFFGVYVGCDKLIDGQRGIEFDKVDDRELDVKARSLLLEH